MKNLPIEEITLDRIIHVDGPALTRPDKDMSLDVIITSRTDDEARAIVINAEKGSIWNTGDEIKLFLEDIAPYHRLAGGLNAPRLSENGQIPQGTEVVLFIQDTSRATCNDGIKKYKEKLRIEIGQLEIELSKMKARYADLEKICPSTLTETPV